MSVEEFKAHAFSLNGSTVLGLKRLDRNRRGYNGLQYPDEGESVSAKEWKANTECGNGLHFWPWGLGAGEGCDFSVATDLFAVVEANLGDVVGLVDGGVKAKAKTLKIVKYGSFSECMSILVEGRLAYIASKAKGDASSSGHRSNAASSGSWSNASSSGSWSNASSSGHRSNASSSGHRSNAASSGDRSNAASSGDYSNASSSGYCANASSSGYWSNASSSGYCANASSSGERSNASSSGECSNASSSGDYSNASSSGDYSNASSSGEQSIAVAIGREAKAMSDTVGAMLVLVGRMEDGTPVCVSGIVGDRFKPGVAYTLNDAGEAVEVKGDE